MARTVFGLLIDVLQFVRCGLRSRARVAAENLFLRKQLALYLERHVKPCRAKNSTRLTLVVLSRFIEWRQCLTIVQPDTLVRWQRDAFRLFCRRKSRPRVPPRIPRSLQRMIIQMANATGSWGRGGISAELRLKLCMF